MVRFRLSQSSFAFLEPPLQRGLGSNALVIVENDTIDVFRRLLADDSFGGILGFGLAPDEGFFDHPPLVLGKIDRFRSNTFVRVEYKIFTFN